MMQAQSKRNGLFRYRYLIHLMLQYWVYLYTCDCILLTKLLKLFTPDYRIYANLRETLDLPALVWMMACSFPASGHHPTWSGHGNGGLTFVALSHFLFAAKLINENEKSLIRTPWGLWGKMGWLSKQLLTLSHNVDELPYLIRVGQDDIMYPILYTPKCNHKRLYGWSKHSTHSVSRCIILSLQKLTGDTQWLAHNRASQMSLISNITQYE